jgi:hypothetical protein
VGVIIEEDEDEVEVIVELEEELADELEAELVGTGIPLYKSAWGLATVGMAVTPAEKDEAGRDIVVVCEAVFNAVTLHTPPVPDGQSTVKLLCNNQKSIDRASCATNARVPSTYCRTPSPSGLVIATWKVFGPSIKVTGAVKSQTPVAEADALHPSRYVVTPFVT